MDISVKQWAISAIVILCAIIGIWYYVGQTKPSQVTMNGTVLRVVATGGLCIYGLCTSELVIYSDGEYIYDDGADVQKQGIFAKEDVDMLTQLIAQADFAAIKAKKFTDICPVAYDGQEFAYMFYAVNETIKSCTVDIDEQSELFSLIEELRSRVLAGL